MKITYIRHFHVKVSGVLKILFENTVCKFGHKVGIFPIEHGVCFYSTIIL